ncbi:Gfo/Idh/MocA family oxidoreductase [Allorhodopirellula heiligendammensis]|uniref:Dehydrogenase n=1 Tax=Allorhodopirellula heiligendammensis TaxID=2714739 RepID=A0A5C6BU58_9BACT|nr:Gfo/Idh/MocA family oxidoreductase [Allorhodopirellula heiligendammensis]TWU15780.1 Dehydrogenase [Allorhodopirellula heiligendammensis]
MSRELRVAVIGGGHLGRIHAKLLSQVDGARLVAVCDPDQVAGQAIATAQSTTQCTVAAYADYRDCIESIDAAIIAAPTHYHAEIATTLLKAGKHLFVEKPIAHESDDARRLALLASTRGLVLQVGHVERFNPAFTALGDFGVDVKYIEATRASRFPGRCLDVGVVMDLMIHDLDLILSLTTAPVSSIAASGLSVVSDHEDIAEARIEFQCGLVANVKASRISPLPARDMVLYSPAGFAQIDFGKPALTTVRSSESLARRDFHLADQTDNPLTYADSLFGEHLQCEVQQLEPRNAILDELHDFVISVQCGGVPVVDGTAGARAVAVAESILNVIDERAWYAFAKADEVGASAIPRRRIEQDRVARRAA